MRDKKDIINSTIDKQMGFLKWFLRWSFEKGYQIPKDKQYLERVRDVLLGCSFTSLRYSDIHNLTRSDIKSDHIEVITVKTVDSQNIELNKYSKAILEKYKYIHL